MHNTGELLLLFAIIVGAAVFFMGAAAFIEKYLETRCDDCRIRRGKLMYPGNRRLCRKCADIPKH